MDRVEKMFGRMKAGKLYKCVDWDPEGKAKDLVDKFNGAPRSETMTRTGEYLGKLFAHMGKECYIEPPFYCDYGTNIHVGDYFKEFHFLSIWQTIFQIHMFPHKCI